jgi:hypothetical protein
MAKQSDAVRGSRRSIAIDRLGVFASIIALVATFGVVTLSSTEADAAGECKRTKFETKMTKEACAKGGQKAAKEAMKAYLKTAKKKTKAITGCPTCHSKVGGEYPLKPDALKLFVEGGGELLATKKAP